MKPAASLYATFASLLLLHLSTCSGGINYADFLGSGLAGNSSQESSLTESLLETRASSESVEPPVVEDEEAADVDAESVSFLPPQSLQPAMPPSNASEVSASTLHEMQELTELFNNASQGSNGFESSVIAEGRTHSGRQSTKFFVASSTNSEFKEPGEVDASLQEEEEGVVLGGSQKTLLPMPKTYLQKSIEWMGDAYTLSILLPIGAGVLFAATIIVSIAFCRCTRRRCRRRRLRKKAQLPDSVKNLRPSDRARLLTESSDEEF